MRTVGVFYVLNLTSIKVRRFPDSSPVFPALNIASVEYTSRRCTRVHIARRRDIRTSDAQFDLSVILKVDEIPEKEAIPVDHRDFHCSEITSRARKREVDMR